MVRSIATLLALVVSLVATSADARRHKVPTYPYEEGESVPAGYHVESHARTGLVVGGAIMFGVSYLATMVVVGLGDRHNSKELGLIPIVGPIALVGVDGVRDDGYALLVLSALQAGGAGMFLGGLFAKKQVLVPDRVSMNIVPTPRGLALIGTF